MSASLVSCAACLRRAVQASSRNRPLAGILPVLPQTSRPYASVASTSIERTEAPRTLVIESVDTDVSKKKDFERLQRIVKKELQHMDDPWKIAQYVERALANDRFDEALLLIKTAGKDRQVVVAWNHLINYLLGKQQLKNAIKLFNDVSTSNSPPSSFCIVLNMNPCR